MATVHSRKTRAHLNQLALACHIRTLGIDHSIDMTDVTTFCDDAYSYIEGIEGGSFSFGGFVDSDPTVTFTPLEDLRQAGSDSVVSVAPNGYAVGEQVWLAEAKLTELGHSSTINDAAAFTLGLMTEGRPDLGVSLHNVTAAETAGGDGASSDNAASSANGGAAVLHVSAFTGTNIVVKVQHSANNSTWADLVTFATVTGVGAEHAVVAPATTVNRYLRATWSGTFTSSTFAVAFARR